MLEIITNNQRKYFGLEEINPDWKEMKIKSENFNGFDVFIFVDKNIVRKCILVGKTKYKEMQMKIELTKNLDGIISYGNENKVSSLDSIINKFGYGMTIYFDAPNINLFNENTKKFYYKNYFDDSINVKTIEDFKAWVDAWCNESTEEDLSDITKFTKESKVHLKFNEGDVFRVKLTRRLYGYGRVLLNYIQMRKNNEKFWDCLMGTPIVASLYHVVTTDKNLTVDDLKNLKSFPSEIILDNNVYYGEYEIIGNIPVDYEKEDYPIMYGRELTAGKTTFFQRGKKFLKLENTEPLYTTFKYSGVSLNLGFKISVMKKCIEESSNLPYYENGPYFVRGDLRNPKNKEALAEVLKQFNLNG